MVYHGRLIYAGKYTVERAEAALHNGRADLVGFGRSFVANPDLPKRLRLRKPLCEPDASRLFGGGAAGYTDHPVDV